MYNIPSLKIDPKNKKNAVQNLRNALYRNGFQFDGAFDSRPVRGTRVA